MRDGKCCVCGSKKNYEVNHIKPRKYFPEEALKQTNLETLCNPCHKKKTAEQRKIYGQLMGTGEPCRL